MAHLADFTLSPADVELAKTLADFLPARIFDAHLHVYDASFMTGQRQNGTLSCSFDQMTMDDYHRQMTPLLPGVRHLRGNLIPMPDPTMADPGCDARERSNDFLVRQLDREPDCVGQVFVRPGDSAECLEAMLARHPNIRGFKCYFYGAGKAYTGNERVRQFLPRAAWEVAHRRGLAITLHLMRSGMADSENLEDIETMARQYPNATLVLAHCGRSFAAWTCIDAAKRLAALDNVWYDLSAVCEPTPMFFCIRAAGAERILWGSDFPICLYRGRSVSLGRGFVWLTAPELARAFPNGTGATLYAVENLLAFRQAAQMLELTQAQREAIFYDNAARLFGER